MNKNITPQKPRLLDQVRERLRYKHYSVSTEKLYVYWIRFFIRWSGLRHPVEMGAIEVEETLKTPTPKTTKKQTVLRLSSSSFRHTSTSRQSSASD